MLVDLVMGQAQFGMRQRVGQVCEEGSPRLGILMYEVESLGVDYILRVCLASRIYILGKVDAAVIIPQMVGIVGVCHALAVVAVETVESHLRRHRLRSRVSEAPLAEGPCGVARIAEERAERVCPRRHGALSFGIDLVVAAYVCVARVQARHE